MVYSRNSLKRSLSYTSNFILVNTVRALPKDLDIFIWSAYMVDPSPLCKTVRLLSNSYR